MDAVSLFSGAGGLDVGFARAGFEVCWANDFDQDACATYRANLGTQIVQGDIETLLPQLKALRGVACVFGGPPCQGFSVAGKMAPDDPRSSLVWSFMRAVEAVQPRAFVMENVRALAKLTRFQAVRTALVRRAQELGYRVELLVLNSRDFGVAQSRERMFLVGFADAIVRGSLAGHVAGERSPTPTVRDVISELGPAGSPTNPRICRARITIAQAPILRRSPYAGMLFNGQGRPINPDGHSCALHASMGGNKTPILDEVHLYESGPSWVEEYHARLMSGGRPLPFDAAPSRLRRLTVDEAVRIQTFPTEYQFQGTQSSILRQIGNAVPCRLAAAVATIVRNALSGEYEDAETGAVGAGGQVALPV